MIRFIFAYVGVDYEDIRIPDSEWPKHKDGMPLQQMPVLEMDGERLCQSTAIYRHLAREYLLYGSTTKETFYIDMYCACFDEIGQKYPFREQDKSRKELLIKDFEKSAPKSLLRVENLMIKYGHGSKFILNKISLADFYLLSFGDFLLPLCSEIFSGVPKIADVNENIRNHPNMVSWIKKRPVTQL